MNRKLKKEQIKKRYGIPPGTIHHDEKKKQAKIRLITYNKANAEEREILSLEKVNFTEKEGTVYWVNIQGTEDINTLNSIGSKLDIHPLILEDIASGNERPKINDFKEYLYVTLRMFSPHRQGEKLDDENIHILFGKNYVISVQEKEDNLFHPIRNRILQDIGRIRKKGADYLSYCLMDIVIDNYLLLLQDMEDNMEEIESLLLKEPSEYNFQRLYNSKQNIILLRKTVNPLRDVIHRLEFLESPLIKRSTAVFIRDAYEHVIHAIDILDTLREMTVTNYELYLSGLSNKMNQIMKVLTLFASIFIPLTFLAGLYGMNFKYMPELEIPWAYPVLLFIMALISTVMLIYFIKKKWIGGNRKKKQKKE
jgi:magnesium transporter